MEEIKIGDYVRTKRNGICKIDDIDNNRPINKYRSFLGYEENALLYRIIKTTEIVNHNKNIIDLLEKGDIINGEGIVSFIQENIVYANDYNFDDSLITYKKEQIKTILTKEQYEANCFRLEV